MKERKRRGGYSGKDDYSLLTKDTWKLPLTAEEKEQLRKYKQETNKRSKQARNATVEGRAHQLWYDAKTRANRTNLEFTLTEEWIRQKLLTGKCEVTSTPFDLSPSNHRVNKHAPSLDKIDQDGGYTETNTRCVVWQFNHARLYYSDQDLLEFAMALVDAHPTAVQEIRLRQIERDAKKLFNDFVARFGGSNPKK